MGIAYTSEYGKYITVSNCASKSIRTAQCFKIITIIYRDNVLFSSSESGVLISMFSPEPSTAREFSSIVDCSVLESTQACS